MMLTDFHSHILPGVDDGSQSIEMSLEMLRAEAADGVSRVVATPHFYTQDMELAEFLRERDRAYEALSSAAAQEPGLPRIEMGAEVYFFPGISQCETLSALTLGGKNHIMVEMPMTDWTDTVYRELEQIWTQQGLIPVIAHLDRYLFPFTRKRILRDLEDLPILVQANTEFFLTRGTESLAMRLLREDRIQVIGTDCHDLTLRKPNLGQAAQKIQAKLGPEALERIIRYENEIL